ncbi:Oxoglutarate/iron-dependent dioxygenase [Corchorus capsularis]|uniref:Oxoglutarate/iron-dependent dioxygenase n=1 Tax=Corchorus capsularis TaxID=210143 RepID=A0A1R3G7Z7_COCAP|nr:Oxoglutarate/iron-dependent dioxygenase [Corchorus capsularis]
MGYETLVTLPVIDFSKQDLMPGTPEWDVLKVQVRQVLQKYGCFEASFDRMVEVRKPLFVALEEFFGLPLETKNLCNSKRHFRGYNGSKAPFHENVLFENGDVAGNVHNLTNMMWPQGNSSFSKTLLSFTEIASGLDKIIRRMILESFGLDKYTDEHMDTTEYNLRLMKNEGRPQTDEPNHGAHYDLGWMTVLYQNEINGLEIQNKDGEWITVKPSSPNSFIIMVGEALSALLNGGLPSPFHRVMMTVNNKTRYSIGLFAAPKGGYQVNVPDELVDEENPLLFKPFDMEEFLGFYKSQLARGATAPERTLKAYCGV